MKEKFIISSFQETAKLLLHIERSTQPINLESTNSVSVHELIIICMSYVFKRREEIRIEKEEQREGVVAKLNLCIYIGFSYTCDCDI